MHPCLKPLKRCCLVLGLCISACNVFNPSGEGDAGASVDAQLATGENAFRNQDYPAAIEAYSKAIEKDSTNSLAYYGYAKAEMRFWQVNASTLLTEVTNAQNGGGIPFIGADDWTMTRYLQATSKVRWALGMMTERDTLTRWFNYSKEPTSKSTTSDPLAAKRIAFINDYFTKADKGLPGFHKKSEFPLSDLKLGYQKIVADYGFVEMIYAVTRLRDLDANDTIDDRDNLLKKLNFNVSGGFKVNNLDSIAQDLKTPESRAQLNNLVQNVASGLGSASTVLGLLTPLLSNKIPGDTLDTAGGGGLSNKVTKNMDSVISSIGDAVTFYQFGDEKDNDGDGCVDEEILDGKDNDGDGFIDEDARINTVAPYLDAVDNDHNGKGKETFTDPDPDEALDGTKTLIYTTRDTFIKGPLYKDKPTRIWVQKDSLDVKWARTGGHLAASDQAVLDSAKTAIGGCWNNYK